MKSLLAILALAVVAAAAASTELDDLRRRADEGDPESLFTLATLYDSGYDSIPVDSLRSTQLYRESAEKGYLPAMNYLGYRLISSEFSGMEKDTREGLDWLEKAAIAGDAKAASNIGWLLSEGNLVEKDYEKAAFWLQKAADSGLPVAMSLLGDLYREGNGVMINVATADSLYSEAFERGLTDAGYKRYSLRETDIDSLSAPELLREGKYYYLRSAPSIGVKLFYMASEKGSPEAMALLGDAYTRAIGVPYDHDLSLRYFARAAEAGNPSAQFVIGELLEIFPDALEGLDIEQSGKPLSSDPLYWYERAAARGITDAETATRILLQEQ